MSINQKKNRLNKETSPYLLQHAKNPVFWMPWGEEAFRLAKEENKLLIVSIGYSSCHWCHVMERECFENLEIADMMNKDYICVKVDREERPDVDNFYMDACNIMTGKGGWPLNAFVLPDGRPVYVGTYFPKNSFKGLLHELASGFKYRKEKYFDYADKLMKGISTLNEINKNEIFPIDNKEVEEIYQNIYHYLDRTNGGKGRAPKFPMPIIWDFLFAYGFIKKEQTATDSAVFSLLKMANGGIYDQIGGGFARYSTDDFWKVPHFEKMLYDNAQLIGLYALAHHLTGNEKCREVVYETFEFLQSELKHISGAYQCALDADSEGIEGKFYIWKLTEIDELLEPYPQLKQLAYEIWNLGKFSYWESDEHILMQALSYTELSDKLNISIDEVRHQAKELKKILWNKRNQRVKPGLDTKILLSWNCLLITGLTDCYRYLQDEKFLTEALSILQALKTELVTDTALYHTKNNQLIDGFIEDYSFYIECLLNLYEVTSNEQFAHEVLLFTDIAISDFYDNQSGFFAFSKKSGQSVIPQKIDISDNVIPSPNSVMASNLWKLSKIFYREDYATMSIEMCQTILPKSKEYGAYYSRWAKLMLQETHPFFEVCNSGKELPKKLIHNYLPNTILVSNTGGITSSIPALQDKTPNKGFYICADKTCFPPVIEEEEVLQKLTH